MGGAEAHVGASELLIQRLKDPANQNHLTLQLPTMHVERLLTQVSRCNHAVFAMPEPPTVCNAEQNFR